MPPFLFYYSEHQIVCMACEEARGLWGFSEAIPPITGGRGSERKKSPMTCRNVNNILLSLVNADRGIVGGACIKNKDLAISQEMIDIDDNLRFEGCP